MDRSDLWRLPVATCIQFRFSYLAPRQRAGFKGETIDDGWLLWSTQAQSHGALEFFMEALLSAYYAARSIDYHKWRLRDAPEPSSLHYVALLGHLQRP